MMTDSDPDPSTSSDLFGRFAVAAWGACWGVIVATAATALLIVARGDTHDQSHPAILPSDAMQPYVVIPWQERYERIWYALACVAGALCAWGAVRFARVSPWLAMPAVLAFIPLALRACRNTFHAHPNPGRILG